MVDDAPRADAWVDRQAEEYAEPVAEAIVFDGDDGGGGESAGVADTTTDAAPVDESAPLGPPRHFEMTILAQDPKVKREDGRILTGTVKVAADRFRAPFQTHRFHLVSFNPRTAKPGPALRLLDADGRFTDRFAHTRSDETLLNSHDFHAQNVFAIASRTLAAFEGGLGRRVPWDFGTHQLYLVPHGEIRANAYYSPAKHAVIFGLVPKDEGAVYSCLSHDIIAHETTHAVLDGLRPGFFTAGLPDQGAFHEGFADIVALLSVFGIPGVTERALGKVHHDNALYPNQVTEPLLRNSFVLQLAEQFGDVIHGDPDRALRQSAELDPKTDWEHLPEFAEVHRRGEVLVAAVANAFLRMWMDRLEVLFEPGVASRTLAAEEGSKAADHLLKMVIRAIDYLPPIEFEFSDFLEAVLVSDSEVVPDDDHGYRRAIEDAFGAFRIRRPERRIIDIAKLRVRPKYERFNFAALRSDRDEVFRFLWENDRLLGINLDFETKIESVRPSIRVGPDGFVLQETVVTYIQSIRAPVAELQSLSEQAVNRYGDTAATLEVPPDVDPKTILSVWGGGVVIFDQFGRPKWHQHKPLLDWERQSRRLLHLSQTAEPNSLGAIGGEPSNRSEPLAALHDREEFGTEKW